MKKLALCLTLLYITIFGLSAQNNSENTKQAETQNDTLAVSDKLFYDVDFSGALNFYKQMIMFDPNNPAFNYSLGYAYINTPKKQDSALIYLKRALTYYNPKKTKNVSIYEIKYYLAYAYFLNQKIDSAVILLENLLADQVSPRFNEVVNKLFNKIDKIASENIEIYHITSPINTRFTEHSPIYIPEDHKLLFTSRRKLGKNAHEYEDGQYDENIFYSVKQGDKWTSVKPLHGIDSSYNEATCSYNQKNRIIIFYRDDQNGSLFWSKYIDGKITTPTKFPKPINSNNFETHACISDDGKTLYIAADRPDGFGGTDIYVSHMNKDGTWSKPVNLGPGVNTELNEDAPFIASDNKTLYFSSEGHGSMGGYDIFVSTRNEFGTWTPARNIGYPINTTADDIFLFPVDSLTAYIASSRRGSLGNTDIFVIKWKPQSQLDTNFYYINTWTIRGYKGNTNTLTVFVENLETHTTAIARPNSNGRFVFITKPLKKYHIWIEAENGSVIYDKTFSQPLPKNKLKKNIEEFIYLKKRY